MASAAERRMLSSQDVKVRRNLKDMGFFYSAVLGVLVFAALASLIVWSRLTVVDLGYEISRADTEREALIERNKRLELEFMALKSPERIERIATKELGLVYPTEARIIRIR